jgi:predicted nucleotidyltransferase
VRSAQDFARGGVNLLANLGVVDTLAFGAEISDIEKLKLAAATFDDKNFAEKLKLEMASGESYAAAVTKILSAVAQIDIRKPNTILAIEYLRALPKNITPLLIPRGKIISSATSIRNELYKKSVAWEKISVPPNVLAELQAAELPNEDFLFRPLLTKILTSKLDDLKKIYGMNEGIEFKLIESARTAENFGEFVGGVVNKRFPISRVKRLLLYFLLNVTAETFLNVGDYARILAFNERGKFLLKKIRTESKIPIVTKVAKHLNSKEILFGKIIEPYKKNLALDLLATDLRETLFVEPKNFGLDFFIRTC